MKEQEKPTRGKTKTSTLVPKETPYPETDDPLRESEQRTRTFLDSTSDMAFLKDESFRHIVVNSALCKFYGKSESEIIGKTDFDLMDEQAAMACRKTDEQALLSNDFLISEEVIGGRYYETRKFPVSIAVGKRGIGAYIRDITERKRVEEALRESEEKFRVLVDSTPAAVMLYQDDRWIYANKAAETICGYSVKELLTMNFWDFIHPDYKSAIQKHGRKRQQGEKTTNRHEFKIIAKDGTQKWVDLSGASTTVQGRLAGIISILDITERRRVEESLRASDAKLRAILDATPFPIAIMDVWDNVIEYWSQSALALFGHTAPTTPEWYQLAYPDPEYRREVIDRWKHFLETARLSGQPVNTGEYRVSCHDGSARVCELYATFLSDKLIVTFNDITERKQAEESLKENAGLLKIAGETAKLGGWRVDLRNNLCIWSDETAAIHERPAGYSPLVEEGINYYAPEWREKITKVFTQCAQNGIPYDEEMEIITANGKRVWVRTIGKPLKDEAGKIIKVQGGFQNITERKQAESQREAALIEIGKLNENLEQRIKERTAELTKTIDLLEETNRAFVGRELRIIELKEQIAELEKRHS